MYGLVGGIFYWKLGTLTVTLTVNHSVVARFVWLCLVHVAGVCGFYDSHPPAHGPEAVLP